MYQTSNCLENLMISTYYPWPKLTSGRRLWSRVLSKCRIVSVFCTKMRKKTNELVIGTITSTYNDRDGSWTLGLRGPENCQPRAQLVGLQYIGVCPGSGLISICIPGLDSGLEQNGTSLNSKHCDMVTSSSTRHGARNHLIATALATQSISDTNHRRLCFFLFSVHYIIIEKDPATSGLRHHKYK